MPKMTYHDKRVLIVDDQRPFLVMLRSTMNTLGATSVMVAESGEVAIAACQQEKFDIIISDLELGDGRRNGFQLLEELRGKKLIKPETIFLMVSGDSQRPMVLGTVEKQPDDYLIKPFSQAQLNNRISKCWAKRSALKSLYVHLMNDDVKNAIIACKDAITSGSRYRQYCSLIMTELLWRENKFELAVSILNPLVRDKQLPWAVLAMAKTKMYMRQFEEAINLAKNILDSKMLAADAHDILAQCYLRTEKLEESCLEIKKAIELSPYSIERQYLGCEIAQASGDYEFAKNCCLAILDQSRRSVHKNISHMCNYIRSILDLAEHASEQKDSNKYQQDAMIELQRQKQTELVRHSPQPFDFNAFESIVSARINVIQGKLQNAKRALSDSQKKIEGKFEEYPLALAPDTIKVMFDLGEYEQASHLIGTLKKHNHPNDPYTRKMLSSDLKKAQKNIGDYNKYNKEGIAEYNLGQHQAAYEAFHKALEQAPTNAGVIINLLQVIIKLLAKTSKPDINLKKECRTLFRNVDGLHLPEAHQKRLATLTTELQPYLE
ncbi:response regulator [Alteromonadaceae bacterium BrNp21-10]|nr:response regulator [Alteromonadaceae bacterium BrNp21-10]